MSIYLLAASVRVLFVVMLIVMIIVTLLFGYIVFMLLKFKKKPDITSSNDVRQMLARRESRIVEEIMATKGNEEKKSELLSKLRRVKSAQILVDELIKEEAQLYGAIEAEEKAKKASVKGDGKNRPAEVRKPVQGGQPPHRPAPNAPRPVQRPVQNVQQAPAPKPAEEQPQSAETKASLFGNKDDNEFKPSED